ncbi:hypothetical protein GQ53DRAFT_430727 [Thozetella sp. PMI_491]|nr:hypothetical protein GQ53DRAFT_430727 [Thozetella sp. PMI_491]
MASIVVLGTCDTKLDQLVFLRNEIEDTSGVKVLLIDVGRTNIEHDAISVSQAALISRYGDSQDVSGLPRPELVKFMSACASRLVRELYEAGSIHGIIAAGGSCGTSLASPIMREALPIGFPKMIVSTVASGDVGPIVGETDITLMYSVVDVAGMNGVLRDVLSNAGASIAAAALSYAKRSTGKISAEGSRSSSKKVGITMFGVTTPGVDTIRHHLETNYGIETYIFHATGHGGKAMERLIREGRLDAVLDLTTTEICDQITGGVMSAGPDRLDAAILAGIPNIVSLGATDMTNFGPKSTVPERYQDRKLYEHNAFVTLMRSSEDECRQIGQFICAKLKKTADPTKVEVWIPKGGVSMISKPGDPFEDQAADKVLFETVVQELEGSGVRVVEDERDINDTGFARDIAEALAKKMGLTA